MKHILIAVLAVLLAVPLSAKSYSNNAFFDTDKIFNLEFDENLTLKIDNLLTDKYKESRYQTDKEVKERQVREFLVHYDAKIAAAKRNTAYQRTLSNLKSRKVTDMYQGDTSERGKLLFNKIIEIKDIQFERSKALKRPSSIGPNNYPERYSEIDIDDMRATDILEDYYQYSWKCMFDEMHSHFAQRLMSSRAELLIDIARESLKVEDMPVFYSAVLELGRIIKSIDSTKYPYGLKMYNKIALGI